MSVNDPLGDMLTRIRNAQLRKKGKVSTPGSRLRGIDEEKRHTIEAPPAHANSPCRYHCGRSKASRRSR